LIAIDIGNRRLIYVRFIDLGKTHKLQSAWKCYTC